MEPLVAWRENPTSDSAIALCRSLTTGPPGSAEDRAALLEVGSAILVKHGDDIEVLLALGRLYLSAGEYLHADAALKRVLEATLSDARAWRLLGEVFLRAGNARDAQKAFEGAVARGMNDPGTLTWLQRAGSYVAMQDVRGAAAVAAEIARGAMAPVPADAMAELGQETLLQPSMQDEETMVAPGLASSGSVMATSVPEGSIVIGAPGGLRPDPNRILTPTVATPPPRRPEPRDKPRPRPELSAAEQDTAPLAPLLRQDPSPPPAAVAAPEASPEDASEPPDSARTLLYKRPEPLPIPASPPRPASHPTLASASDIAKSPAAADAAAQPSPALTDTLRVETEAHGPSLGGLSGGRSPPDDAGEEIARPRLVPAGTSGTGVRIADKPAAQVPEPAQQILDEMSMSIHMLRPDKEMPQSDRSLDKYLDEMRRGEGLDIDEPTRQEGPPPAPAGAPAPGPPPMALNPIGGGTIPMLAFEEVRRAEQAYNAGAGQPPHGMAQVAAPFRPPQQPAPPVAGLPSVMVNAPPPAYAQPSPQPVHGPPLPILPPPVQLAAPPTVITPVRRTPRTAIVVVVLLALLVMGLACAFVYLRFGR